MIKKFLPIIFHTMFIFGEVENLEKSKIKLVDADSLVAYMSFEASTQGCKSPINAKLYRDSLDYQKLYDFVVQNSHILQGILHQGRTFGFLCVEYGYENILLKLLTEGYLVDCKSPCEPHGFNEPQTTLLIQLFRQIDGMHQFLNFYQDDVSKAVLKTYEDLVSYLLEKHPELLDTKLRKERTPRDYAKHRTSYHYCANKWQL